MLMEARRPPSNPLPRWQRRVLVASAWSLLLSGAAWLPLHHLWGAGAGELPSPLEPWLMRWHGLAVLGGLYALGMVSAGHVPRGWRAGRQRASGLFLCVLWGLLAASGYGLSYLVSERWRGALGWAHAGAGFVAFAVGALHSRPIRWPIRLAHDRTAR
jgi:hypothetical protein